MNALHRALACAVPALVLGTGAFAQVEAPPFTQVPYTVDSGWVGAPTGSPAGALALSSTVTIQQPGAQWIRIYFDEVVLAGDPLAGNGAELRIISLVDGGTQVMNAIEVERWRNSTAYFNGDTVVIEVWAEPRTGTSRVSTATIDMGLAPAGEDSICGNFDDRLPSSDPRSGRLLPIGCTGWLIQDCAGCALTAGHCAGNISVLQFNVPPSNSNGSINNPPPGDQYPIDPASVQSNGGQGVGNDYAYFGVFPNGTTGLSVTAAQGPGFVLSAPPSPGGASIRITGFGTDQDNPNRNQTQQTHVGPLVTSGGTTVQYVTDTTGGNSGSPVIWEQTGNAVGIHTHGGCSASGGQNSGTSYTISGLQAFLADPMGVCGGGLDVGSVPTVLPRGIAVQVSASITSPIVPGTATLHARPNGSGMFQSIPMTDMGSGQFVADLPAYDCGDLPEFYFSVQSVACGQLFAPIAGAQAPFGAEVGTPTVTFADNFQTNMGWQAVNLGATSGDWQRGVPVNDSGWAHDPASDGDGSGRCYVTQNQVGNTDVDNGAVRLTSPTIAVTHADSRVSYLYFLQLTRENAEDRLLVEVSANGGASWTEVRRYDDSTSFAWVADTISAAELAVAGVVVGSQLQVRFTANDDNTQSIVEAGVDGFAVDTIDCNASDVGVVYCSPAVSNSSGAPATLRGEGSESLAANNLTLIAESLPTSSLGYFLVSETPGFLAGAGGSVGNLCLAGDIGRYAGNVLSSGAGGTFMMPVDLTAIPQPTGAVGAMVGETWRFQAWFRDVVLFPTSNFTPGLAVTIE